MTLTIMSAFGSESCVRSRRKDGIATATRISTGTMVQATSIAVLWVVREGVGFRFSLKRKTHHRIRPSTKTEMASESQCRPISKLRMSRAFSVTGTWRLISHGSG